MKNDPEIEVLLKDKSGKQISYNIDKDGNYKYQFTKLEPGNYSITLQMFRNYTEPEDKT